MKKVLIFYRNKGYIFILFLILFINIEAKSQKSNIELSGDILEIVIPATALGSTLIYNDNYKGAIQFIKAFGTSMLITHSLKRIINKRRPNGGDLSFPSGHTTSAFASAAFLERRYGWKVGIPSYIIASYVGWSRIYANKHDIYDVLAGATVGILSSYLFTKPYKNLDISVGTNNFKLNYQF